MTTIIRFDGGNLSDRYWTKEESELLESLIGEYPIELLMGKLQEYWQKNGMKYRSRGAIRTRIYKKERQGTRSEVDNYSQRQLGALLGIGRKRLNRILAEVKGLVRLSRYYAISRRQLKNLIMKRPNLFAGIDAEVLYFAIGGDEESPAFFDYCEDIAELVYTCPNTRIRVRRVDTGEVFDSLTLAAAAAFCSKDSVSRVVKGQAESSCGLRWEYVDRIPKTNPPETGVSAGLLKSI